MTAGTSRAIRACTRFVAAVLAGALVAAAVLLPVRMEASSRAEAPVVRLAVASAETTTETTPTPPPAPDATVTVLAVGDLMCHSQLFRAAWTPRGYDFVPMFRPVASLVASADIAAGNLETTLRRSSPYSGYPCFRTPRSYARALKATGFDVLTTANNHALDGGATGLRYTASYLDDLGLAHTGTDNDGPAIVEHDGVRVAFLAYTYGTNGIHSPFDGAVNRIRLASITAAIERVRGDVDIVAVCLHWGAEYRSAPEAATRKLGRQVIDAGADLILGSHPHVVRPVEKYKGHYIVYSMGNFTSGMTKSYTDLGIMVQATVVRRDGTSTVDALKVIPVYRDRSPGHGRSTYRVVEIAKTLAHPDSLTSAWDKARMRRYRTYCRSMFKGYL